MSAQLNRRWGPLSRPVCPASNHAIATAMSARTRDGRVPTFEEAAEDAQRRSYAYAETMDGRYPSTDD